MSDSEQESTVEIHYGDETYNPHVFKVTPEQAVHIFHMINYNGQSTIHWNSETKEQHKEQFEEVDKYLLKKHCNVDNELVGSWVTMDIIEFPHAQKCIEEMYTKKYSILDPSKDYSNASDDDLWTLHFFKKYREHSDRPNDNHYYVELEKRHGSEKALQLNSDREEALFNPTGNKIRAAVCRCNGVDENGNPVSSIPDEYQTHGTWVEMVDIWCNEVVTHLKGTPVTSYMMHVDVWITRNIYTEYFREKTPITLNTDPFIAGVTSAIAQYIHYRFEQDYPDYRLINIDAGSLDDGQPNDGGLCVMHVDEYRKLSPVKKAS